MRPVSDRFLRTLRGSHTMAARARVVAPGQTGVDPAGIDIPILGGDVQLDGNAAIRSTLDLTTDGNAMWPTIASGLLAPYGNEVFVERGIEFGNDTREMVSLGYYRIQAPEQDQAPNGPIRIEARDRMAGIVEARMLAPRQFAATATYGAVLSALVAEVYPWAVIEWDDTTDAEQVGRALIAEEDRYAFCNDLVTSVGKIWYWDYRGALRVRNAPSSVDPVFDVDAGEGGVLVKLSRRLSREGVYNAVVATGEGVDALAPVRAVAVDNNPASPTYWNGAFGKVPRYYSSPFITTPVQAASAAAPMLTRSLGLPYSADLTAVPNPALEPYDPVQVRYPGRSEVHVLGRLTVPLVARAALTAATREQTVVLVGVG